MLDPCDIHSSSTNELNSCDGKRYFFPFFQNILTSNQDQQVYSITDFLRVFPIFLFTYTCQQNTYNLINELIDPTPKRIYYLFLFSILFSTCLFFIISYAAYFTFGDLVAPDVLYSYPGKSDIPFFYLSSDFCS